MRKLYAFLAAALISVCAFASKEQVPGDAVLAGYYETGQLCVAIFVPADMACNDIVFAGTYNNWAKGSGTVEDAANCTKFQAIEGYDGWYVVAVEDESESIEGKPIMLDEDGEFSWQYQIGTATLVRGTVSIVAGYSGEIDLKGYDKSAPVVLTVDSWKENPCTAVYHNYTFAVINSSGCEGFAIPFIVGDVNKWQFAQMQVDAAKTAEYGVGYYYYNVKAAEGTKYQIVSGLMANDGTIAEQPGWNDASYLQEFKDDEWKRITDDAGEVDLRTGTEALILFDLRDATKYRWARCVERVNHTYTITAQFPTVDAPAQVEVRGGWRDEVKEGETVVTPSSWDQGVVMTAGSTPGLWTATIDAYEGCEFKFCSHALGWGKQIQVYDTAEDTWKDAGNQKFGADEAVAIDFSDPDAYQWTPGAEPEGIEDIVLTEKAHKVMVDGVLYIIRDNKMYNALGTQVR